MKNGEPKGNAADETRDAVLSAVPSRSHKLTDGQREARSYQLEAISAWRANGYQGILAMATGTGKTLTSLLAAESFLADHDDVTQIIVVAPFQHLADQWADEFSATDFTPIKAYKSTAKWQKELAKARIIYRHLEKPLIILTTYATLGSESFGAAVAAEAERTLLIADECHYLGAPGCREFMMLGIPFRLGLSATPERHFDEEGTDALLKYFGSVVYEFGMADAIQAGFLTPYRYYPEFVELTGEEASEYGELSMRISKAAAQAQNASKSSPKQERLKYLLIRRARIINNAANKLAWLREKLIEQSKNGISHTLVYTGEELFPQVVSMLGNELDIPVHSFTGNESAVKRRTLLKQFADGELKILVAMRCLDEGVDVPATKTAYFLASSTNARQYVQRRGRVLRRSEGKEYAVVHDTIVIPPKSLTAADDDNNGRGAFVSQFGRIEEFALLASNAAEVSLSLLDIRIENDLPLAAKPTKPKGTVT